MRTIRTKLYKFSELTEKAQQRAMEDLCSINVDFDWWKSTYEDAANVGIKITSFDLDRSRYADGKFTLSAYEVANKIKANHGENCETHKTAVSFIEDWDKLVKKYSDGITLDKVAEDKEYEFDREADELEEDFRKSILEDYSIILQKECDYLQSFEAIKETIEVNDYEFTQDGKRF